MTTALLAVPQAVSQAIWAIPASVRPAVLATALILAGLAAGWLFERVVLRAMRAVAARTRTELDDLVIRAIHPAVAVLVFAVTIHAGLAYLQAFLPPQVLATWKRLLLAIGVVVGAIIVARVAGGLIRHVTHRKPVWQSVGRLGTRIGNVVVYLTAFLVILGSYGISITPIITSVGLAGLAVALALQDTLSNFFSGVWIQTGRSMQPGHFVRLEDQKIEGYVEEVGWRTTKIRQLGNNITVVPNSRMASAVVTDFHLPEPRMSLLVPISVGYECDARAVERILVEEALAAARTVPGLLAEPAPFVRFIPGFGDYALQFTLICQVREFVDQYLAQHELRLRILDRFRAEGIRIPYPIRESFAVPPTRADVAPPAK